MHIRPQFNWLKIFELPNILLFNEEMKDIPNKLNTCEKCDLFN